MKILKNLLFVGAFVFAITLGYIANHTDVIDKVVAQSKAYYGHFDTDTLNVWIHANFDSAGVALSADSIHANAGVVFGTDSSDKVEIVGTLVITSYHASNGTTGHPYGSIVSQGDSLWWLNDDGAWVNLSHDLL